jgi:hypothetical protein
MKIEIKRIRSKAFKPSELVEVAKEVKAFAQTFLTRPDVKHTSDQHLISQAIDRLDTSSKKLQESMKLLGEAKGGIKADWRYFFEDDYDEAKKDLLSLCGRLESFAYPENRKYSAAIRSQVAELENLKRKKEALKHGDTAWETLLDLSQRAFFILQSLDGLSARSFPSLANTEEYYDFSRSMVSLQEGIKKLRESTGFYGRARNELKHDWRVFVLEDSEELRKAFDEAFYSAVRVADRVGNVEGP